MSKLNYWRAERKTRAIRMLTASIMAILTMVSLSFSSLIAHAAASLSFSDIALLYAYIYPGDINTSNSIKSNDGGGYTITGGGTENSDWKLSGSGPVALDISEMWSTIDTLSNAYRDAQNGIDSVKYPNTYKMGRIAALVVNSYGSQNKFETAVKDVIKSAGGTVNVELSTGDYSAGDSAYSGKLSSAVTNINADLVSIAAQSTFDQIYDMSDWDPNEGIAADVLAGIYSVINTLFYFVANILMWFFIGQSALDMLYIAFEPIRPFIGPKGSGGSLSVNNGGDGLLSKLHIPICSVVAEEAISGGGGGLGGNGAGTNSSKAAMIYLAKRAPLLITIAIYFILAVLGYWRLVISWVAGFVIKIIDFIISLGG